MKGYVMKLKNLCVGSPELVYGCSPRILSYLKFIYHFKPILDAYQAPYKDRFSRNTV